MGFLNNESSSKTSIYSPTEKSPVTADNASVAIRGGSAQFDTLSPGAAQYRLGANSRVSITQTADPALLKNIVDTQNSTLQQFLEGTAAQSATQGGSLAEVLSKLTDLAESKQTGGESGRDKTIAYIVLAALAVVAVWLVFGRGK